MVSRQIVFATERLEVGSFVPEDLDSFMAYHNDAYWMRFQGFKCRSREEYGVVLLREVDIRKGAQLAILLDGQLIGDLYVQVQGRSAEVGYSLHPDYTGRGYGREALEGLCGFLQERGVREVLAEVHRDNIPSMRLLEAGGFFPCGQEGEIQRYRREL